MSLSVSCFCPPMRIVRVKRRLRRADEEPVKVTILRPGIGPAVYVDADIPQTFVDQLDAFGLRWRVRACAADTADGKFVMDLPPEDVLVHWDTETGKIAAFAQPIDCPTTFVDDQGVTWKGIVHFGQCRADIIDLTTAVAEAITATGTLEKAT